VCLLADKYNEEQQMALNFPATPEIDDIFTDGTTTWIWDGVAWNVAAGSAITADVFKTIAADSGTTTANQPDDTLTITGGVDISTSIVNDTLTVDFTGIIPAAPNVFQTINAQSGGMVADQLSDNITIAGAGIVTTSISGKTITITGTQVAPVLSINDLTDVDTFDTTPSTGDVLKWDGAKWAPGTDVASGGAGLDATTLSGFSGSYYLNYNNLNNKPTVPTDLSDLTDTTNLIPAAPAIEDVAGTPTLATGITAAEVRSAIGAGTSSFDGVFASLTSKPTTISGYGITDAVVDFADLGVTPTTLSGYGITNALAATAILSDLTDVSTATPANGQALIWDGAQWGPDSVSGGGGDPDQNVFTTIFGDAGTFSATTTTDSFTIATGANLSSTASGKTVTINFTGTLGSTTYAALTDVTTANRTIDKSYLPAFAMLRLNNNGNLNYTCESHGYNGANPTFYAIGGMTIAFDLSVILGHPFEIQDGTGTAYNTGLIHVDTIGNVTTGAAANGRDGGTLYWEVPETISGGYRYQCTLHPAMVGAITIKRISVI
jgi:hypothetical protein